MSSVALAASRSSSTVFVPPANTTEKASATAWIAVLASMIGAFMAILNIQITNASLLDIEGGIGTGADNGSWISTSYLIGEIVVIPLTDYLSRVFSFRIYLITNAIRYTPSGTVLVGSRVVRDTAGSHSTRIEVRDSGIGIAAATPATHPPS